MRVLDRYIVLCLARYTALSLGVLLVLMAVFLFVNEQGWVGPGNYGQWQALRYVLLQLPGTALEFLPVAALLGALLGLGQLARGSEFTVMRAAGVSISRIAGSVALAGLTLVPAAAAVAEWVAPPLSQAARITRALERNGSADLVRGASWLRDGNLLLRADAHGGFMLFELDGTRRLVAAAVAGGAQPLPDGTWELRGLAETRFDIDTDIATGTGTVSRGAPGSRRLQSAIDTGFLQLSGADPARQSFSGLRRAMQWLEAAGQDATAQRFAFWNALARLAAVPLAMLLAVPLLAGFLRSAEGGARAALGLVLGLVYFIAQRMVESGTLAFNLDPLPLAWLPTVLLALAVAWLLWRGRGLPVSAA